MDKYTVAATNVRGPSTDLPVFPCMIKYRGLLQPLTYYGNYSTNAGIHTGRYHLELVFRSNRIYE